MKKVVKKRMLSLLLTVVLIVTSIIGGSVVESHANNEEVISIYLAGDSTVADWSTIKSDPNYYDPQAGWGQMLSRYFDGKKINVINGAISGYSCKTFYDGCTSKGDNTKHLDELLKDAKEGDYLLVQFGHNDSFNPYDENGNVVNPGRPDLVERYVTPEQYKDYLKKYITDAKAKGVTPILVTPVGRMYTEDGQDHKGGSVFVSSFPDYVNAMKELAREQGVTCIDLDALSRAYYNVLGWEGAKDIFLWCDPGFYPNSSAYGTKGASDTTHFQKFGAIQIARMVAQGMCKSFTDLQTYALGNVETPISVPVNDLNVIAGEVKITSATINWDFVDGADAYRIYRANTNSDGSAGNYKLIAQTMKNSFSDNNLTSDTTYFYKVTAKNYVGENEGEIVEIQTNTNVTGGASYLFDFNIEGSKTAEGWTGVTVNKKGGSGATGYFYSKEQGYGFLSENKLYGRSEDVGANGNYTIPKEVYTDFVLAAGETFAVDVENGIYTVQVIVGSTNSNTTKVSIEGGTTYSINPGKSAYKILNISGVEVSDGQLNLQFSGEGRVNGIIISSLEAPQNLVGTMNWDDVCVDLSWEKVKQATSYEVYRKGNDGNLKLLASLDATHLGFKDSDITLLETYTYTVRAKNAAGIESASCNEVTLTIKDNKNVFSDVKFDFGDGAVADGYVSVTSECYTLENGYGFDSTDGVTTGVRNEDALIGDYCEVDGTDFLVNLENGKNYEVTVTLAGPDSGNGVINIAYEKVTQDQIVPNIDPNDTSDRSGLLNEKIAAGETISRTFTVAIVDGQLNLNVSGDGRICAVEIKQLQSIKKDKTTVFIMGDSTVESYAQSRAPITGWGQTINGFFSDDVAFKNHAIGGRSTGNYLRQGRLNEVLTNVSEGDYVLIQFGHNDASKGNEDRYVSVSDYKNFLTEEYIKGIIQRGGIPILITLVNRNDFNSSTNTYKQSFSDYVNAMKEVAAETNTAIVDLNEMSRVYLNELASKIGHKGVGDIIYLHVLGGYYDSYPDNVTDDTHFQQYGGKVIGSLVAKGLANLNLKPLSNYYKPEEVPDAVPNAPSNLKIEQSQGASVRFQWHKAEDADYYRVERGVKRDGVTLEFSNIGYTVTPVYVDAAAAPNTNYVYRIIAINKKGESESSQYLSYSYEESLPLFQFDFNIMGSESASDGWIGVTVNKKNGTDATGYQYTKAQGYGFVTTNTLYGRYEEVGNNENYQIPSAVYKDFVLAAGETFAVDLQNGKYTVKIIVGSINANTTKVTIENGEEHSINPGKSQYGVLTIPNVVVEDGQMNLAFGGNGRLNGIQIYEEKVVEEPSTEETTEETTEESTEESMEESTVETTAESIETTTDSQKNPSETLESSTNGQESTAENSEIDTSKCSTEDNVESSSESIDSPETGDHGIRFIWILLCISTCTIFIAVKRKKDIV